MSEPNKYHNCETCGAYAVSEHHKCPPIFLAIDIEDDGDDWDGAYKIHAFDSEAAAQKAADRMDDNCGEGAHEREISIKDPDGIITKWSISFDYSVDYSATEVKE